MAETAAARTSSARSWSSPWSVFRACSSPSSPSAGDGGDAHRHVAVVQGPGQVLVGLGMAAPGQHARARPREPGGRGRRGGRRPRRAAPQGDRPPRRPGPPTARPARGSAGRRPGAGRPPHRGAVPGRGSARRAARPRSGCGLPACRHCGPPARAAARGPAAGRGGPGLRRPRSGWAASAGGRPRSTRASRPRWRRPGEPARSPHWPRPGGRRGPQRRRSSARGSGRSLSRSSSAGRRQRNSGAVRSPGAWTARIQPSPESDGDASQHEERPRRADRGRWPKAVWPATRTRAEPLEARSGTRPPGHHGQPDRTRAISNAQRQGRDAGGQCGKRGHVRQILLPDRVSGRDWIARRTDFRSLARPRKPSMRLGRL